MEQLIKIDDENKINAKELHEFLEVKTRFSPWILRRIDEYEFTQPTDFINIQKRSQYNQIDTSDYLLSIDMAKELCMVERNEKGRIARKYFIECESRLRNIDPTMRYLSEYTKTNKHYKLMLDSLVVSLESERVAKEANERSLILEARIDKMNGDSGYRTVLAFMRDKKDLPLKELTKLGKAATKRTTELGYELGKVPDERFGSVNSYPIFILDNIYTEMMEEEHV